MNTNTSFNAWHFPCIAHYRALPHKWQWYLIPRELLSVRLCWKISASLLLKLDHALESPGGLVKTQIVGFHPRVSDSIVGLAWDPRKTTVPYELTHWLFISTLSSSLWRWRNQGPEGLVACRNKEKYTFNLLFELLFFKLSPEYLYFSLVDTESKPHHRRLKPRAQFTQLRAILWSYSDVLSGIYPGFINQVEPKRFRKKQVFTSSLVHTLIQPISTN